MQFRILGYGVMVVGAVLLTASLACEADEDGATAQQESPTTETESEGESVESGETEGSDEVEGSGEPQAEPGGILAMGDSIMAWNQDEGESIPDALGEALGRDVVNASEGGAVFSLLGLEEFADTEDIQGYFIPTQYQAGDWDWVVIDGGGNDLNDKCGCGDCAAVQDDLVSADGMEGEIPEFVSARVAEGSRVLFLGYYDLPAGAEFGFDGCEAAMAEHNQRLETMAAALGGVYFLSPKDVVKASNTDAYDSDLVHPSPLGSALIGEYVAEALETIDAQD